MFVVSLKATKSKLLVLSLASLAVVLLIAFLVTPKAAHTATPQVPTEPGLTNPVDLLNQLKSGNVSAATNEERVAFLNKLGWEVSANPVEAKELTIPDKFDSVLAGYNKVQKLQGLDLERYRGKTVKRWSYSVTNYPGTQESVRANILVYNNKIIGGDVSSTSLNGFMQGFSRPSA